MQDLSWHALFSTEFIGILIAVLGFSGADKWVERVMRRALENWRANAPGLGNEALSFFPSWRNFKRHWKTAGIMIIAFVAIYFLYLQHQPVASARIDYLLGLFTPWTPWKIGIAIIAGPFALYFIWALWTFLFGLAGYILMSIAWRFTWLLSRPPSGILGTIGLIVALYNPAMRWAAENGLLA